MGSYFSSVGTSPLLFYPKRRSSVDTFELMEDIIVLYNLSATEALSLQWRERTTPRAQTPLSPAPYLIGFGL